MVVKVIQTLLVMNYMGINDHPIFTRGSITTTIMVWINKEIAIVNLKAMDWKISNVVTTMVYGYCDRVDSIT